MNPWTITLFPDEVAAAVAVAARRRIECNAHRRKAVKFEQEGAQRWGVEIEAASAEVAISRLLNLAWTGMSGVARRDVGDMIEVRHSVHANAHLVIYPEDDPPTPFVLATGRDGTYTARGWNLPVTAFARDEWRREGQSHWVPQSELRDMDELLGLVRKRLVSVVREVRLPGGVR